MSLLNIITELKKACNHPFLFESAEDEYRGSEEDKSVVDRLILTSGKMVLLDKLMRKLRETEHRVLVFSQVSCGACQWSICQLSWLARPDGVLGAVLAASSRP